jgi:hypothetical protein
MEAMARAMCVYQGQDPDRVLESLDRRGRHVIMWTHWKGEADAAILALREWLEAEGLVVVPREATGWMLAHGENDNIAGCHMDEIWRSMIAAAPDALRAEGE